MLKEVKKALAITSKFIKENMPAFEAGYELLVGPGEEKRSTEQMDLILECCKKLSTDHSNLEEIIEENYKNYLKNDNLYFNMRKRHKRSQDAADLIKEIFKNHLIGIARVLRGEGETYDELSRSINPTYEIGLKYIEKEVELTNRIAQLIREDRGIINAPGVVRYDIMQAVINLLEYSVNQMMDELKRIYNK